MSKKYIYAISTLIIIVISFGLYINYKTNNTYNNSSNMMQNSDSMMMDNNSMSMSNMANLVTDDKTFLENMIPHHQEAIDSSQKVVISTSNTDLKTFAQNVITDQTKEIEQMKSWYKSWYDADYKTNTNYQAMMTDMNGKIGKDLDQSYIKGMISHHQGAIQMAQKALTVVTRSENKTLANTIITNQTKEVIQLKDWLLNKYNDHTMMNM